VGIELGIPEDIVMRQPFPDLDWLSGLSARLQRKIGYTEGC